ncbi:MAG: cysteine desulfurase family protein [Pseudomonadota bacterium]
MIYLDNNATTRPAPEVIDAMAACLARDWGNPSSSHAVGQDAKRVLGEARSAVAALLGAHPVEVVFTSGATEANQWVLEGASAALDGKPPLLLLSAIEHSAQLKAARRLAQNGRARLELMPVDRDGRVDLAAAARLIAPGVRLVSLMAANNETGVVQPVAEVAALAKAAGALFHIDATQAIGKLPFDFAHCGADLVSLSAHKVHGPKGIGALLVRKGLVWPALLSGSQERARRGGTENLPGIAGFGAAARLAAARLRADGEHLSLLRGRLEQGLQARLPVRVFGAGAARLPNTLSLRIGTLDADLVLARMEQAGFIAASGSACSAGGNEPSHVLTAMGIPPEEARGAIRLSLSRDNTIAEIDALLERLPGLLAAPLAEAA